ncbi:hypothetical protein EYF80_013784 [Liparis tanakae]|uniref:Uncharacterized protein n=1 Tax=Liparis tanakae TaxID=230148 RepID=A0A4Z2IE41_9TELE|nr:hypothetical protein EYF80_013784 [Liparis tanakae]
MSGHDHGRSGYFLRKGPKKAEGLASFAGSVTKMYEKPRYLNGTRMKTRPSGVSKHPAPPSPEDSFDMSPQGLHEQQMGITSTLSRRQQQEEADGEGHLNKPKGGHDADLIHGEDEFDTPALKVIIEIGQNNIPLRSDKGRVRLLEAAAQNADSTAVNPVSICAAWRGPETSEMAVFTLQLIAMSDAASLDVGTDSTVPLASLRHKCVRLAFAMSPANPLKHVERLLQEDRGPTGRQSAWSVWFDNGEKAERGN